LCPDAATTCMDSYTAAGNKSNGSWKTLIYSSLLVNIGDCTTAVSQHDQQLLVLIRLYYVGDSFCPPSLTVAANKCWSQSHRQTAAVGHRHISRYKTAAT
jgi:hypothetical protein